MSTTTPIEFTSTTQAAIWITGFANPFDGKRLTIVNTSGKNTTLFHLHTGSSTANRIVSPTGANIAVTGDGAFELVYSDNINSGNGAWLVTSAQS